MKQVKSKRHFRKTKEGTLEQAKPSTIRGTLAKTRRVLLLHLFCLPWTPESFLHALRWLKGRRRVALFASTGSLVLAPTRWSSWAPTKSQVQNCKDTHWSQHCQIIQTALRHAFSSGMEVAWNIISLQNLDKLHAEFTRCHMFEYEGFTSASFVWTTCRWHSPFAPAFFLTKKSSSFLTKSAEMQSVYSNFAKI